MKSKIPIFLNFFKTQKIKYALLLILLVLCIGVIGFIFIENYSFIDALYMTIITVGTVGFSEVQPLSVTGKIFTIFLIISSLGIFTYAISIITTTIVEGEFRLYLQGYKTQIAINKMENHVIVCGYGRNGQKTVEELKEHNQTFIVIEQNKEIVKTENENSTGFFIEGDASTDEVLIKAGIAKAKALIATLPIDADNLYISLSARYLNPKLLIISRAANESAEKKLKMAGVDNVVMPEKVGGSHMASLVIKPDVVEFLNNLIIREKEASKLEEIQCSHIPDISQNKTIKDLDIKTISGVNIIGVKTPEGNYIINPSADTILTPNSKLFVLGTPLQIEKMKQNFIKHKPN